MSKREAATAYEVAGNLESRIQQLQSEIEGLIDQRTAELKESHPNQPAPRVAANVDGPWSVPVPRCNRDSKQNGSIRWPEYCPLFLTMTTLATNFSMRILSGRSPLSSKRCAKTEAALPCHSAPKRHTK